MVAIGISEFTFGFAFLYEQTRRNWHDLVAAPVLPSLRQEADDAWDARLPLEGTVFYFQFKVSDLLSHSNSRPEQSWAKVALMRIVDWIHKVESILRSVEDIKNTLRPVPVIMDDGPPPAIPIGESAQDLDQIIWVFHCRADEQVRGPLNLDRRSRLKGGHQDLQPALAELFHDFPLDRVGRLPFDDLAFRIPVPDLRQECL